MTNVALYKKHTGLKHALKGTSVFPLPLYWGSVLPPRMLILRSEEKGERLKKKVHSSILKTALK